MNDLALVALVVSIASALVAALSLGWNIYRDVILRPRVEVHFGVRVLMTPGERERTEHIVIAATNFGPGAVTVAMIQARNSSLWKMITRKVQHAVVLHDYENPLGGRLPRKLEVGDRADLLLPYDSECMLNTEWTQVGLNDYYGRVHWATRKQVREARDKWLRDFGGREEA